jgi:hypothetical protein
MLTKNTILLLLFITVTTIFSGCSGGGGSSNDNTKEPPDTLNLAGVIQKGAFTDGQIIAQKIEDNGTLSQQEVTSKIDSNGEYSIDVPWKGLTYLSAEGHFINEITGSKSTDMILLSSIIDLHKQENTNINLFTSLESERILGLLQDGKTYSNALSIVQDEMEQVFGLSKTVNAGELNIRDLNSSLADENINLLLLSGTFLKIADSTSSELETDRVTASLPLPPKGRYGAFAQRFFADFQDNGKVDSIFENEWGEMIDDDENETLSVILPVGKRIEDIKLPERQWSKRLQVIMGSPNYIYDEDANLQEIKYNISITSSNFPDLATEYTLNYETKDITAKAGSDYNVTSGTLTFSKLKNIATISIPVIKQSASDKKLQLHVSVSDEHLVIPNSDYEIIIPKPGTNIDAETTNITTFAFNALSVDNNKANISSSDKILMIGTQNSDTDLYLLYQARSSLPASYFISVYAIVEGEDDLLVKRRAYVYAYNKFGPYYWQIANIKIPLTDTLKTHIQNAQTAGKEVRFKVVAALSANNTMTKSTAPLPTMAEIGMHMNPNTEISSATYNRPLDEQCHTILSNSDVNLSGETLYASMDIAGTYNQTGMNAAVSVVYEDVCVKLQKDTQAEKNQYNVEMLEGEGHVTRPLQVKLAGNLLDIDVRKIVKDKVYASKVTLKLPKQHSIHTLNINGQLAPRGEAILPLQGSMAFGVDKDLSTLSLSGTIKSTTVGEKYYLHAKNLPFMFGLDSYSLSSSGFEFKNSDIKYVFDYANRHENNSELFSNPAQKTVEFSLDKDGIYAGSIQFLQSAIDTSFPRLHSTVSTFEVAVKNSQLSVNTNPKEHLIETAYLQNCYGGECSGDNKIGSIDINATTTQLFADGSLVSSKVGSLGENVTWGMKEGDSTHTVYNRTEDSDARIFVGGYTLPTNDEGLLGSYLLGSVKVEKNSLSYYNTQTEEAKEGKYLFAGINLGNFEDMSQNKLDAKKMTIALGEGVELNVTSNDHSKYYLRRGGVTGVFNDNGAALPTVKVYGYNMKFDAFKFRLTDNKLDEFTKIDGGIYVPGKGDFDILFTNLALKCDGNLASGKISEKQGNVVLSAWKTDSILTTLDFEDPNAAICSSKKELKLGHILKIAALKNKIGLNTFWSPMGVPFDSRIISDRDNQIDGNSSQDDTLDNGGYNIALRDIAFDSANNGEQSIDWIETNSTFGLPFWGTNDMSVRLQNKTLTTREPTVVTSKGELYQNGRALQNTNVELIQKINQNYKHNVNHNWANMIDFSLPVYYNASTDITKTPQFLGRKLSSDLIVMKADAGVTYITPDKTAMNFGASANFEKLKGLNLHIDLNDPQSIADIDQMLNRYLGIKNALHDTIGTLVENINIGNKLMKDGITLSMEESAYYALKHLGDVATDPFEAITKINAEVHAIPYVLEDNIKDIFVTQLGTLLNDVGMNETVKPEELEDIYNNYTTLVSYTDTLSQRVDAIPNIDVNATINSIKTKAFGSSNECNYENFTKEGFFKPIGKANKAITDVNKGLQKIPLAKIRTLQNKVQEFSGIETKNLVNATKKVQQYAIDLDSLVNDMNSSLVTYFDKTLCEGFNEQLQNIDTVKNMITKLNDQINLLKTQIQNVQTALKETEVRTFMEALHTNPSDINATLGTYVQGRVENSISGLDGYVIALEQSIPNIKADDMRRLFVTQIFALDAVQNLNIEVNKKLEPIADQLNNLSMQVFSGFDQGVNELLASVNTEVNKLLSAATSTLDNIPLSSAKMDGQAVFYGDTLYQVHVLSQFDVSGSDKDNSFGFKAAFDVYNTENNDSVGCESANTTHGNLVATISTKDIKMSLGEKEFSIDWLMIGATIDMDATLKGIFGGIASEKGLQFDTFKLYELGLGVGIGETENYLGAKAHATMDTTQFGVSFVVGQLCNRAVFSKLVPKAIDKFITIPNNKFNGALVFGEAQIPIWYNGCALTVNARAKLGTWFLFGPPKTYGGIVGGGAFGKALCIATLGGEVEALGEKSGDVFRFKGSGWGAAGVGSCDSSWSSVGDSRSDSWCGTGDARFGASYDAGWSLEKIRTSAVH